MEIQASVETTLKVYTHVVAETHRKAIEDLERVLFPSIPKSGREACSGRSVS